MSGSCERVGGVGEWEGCDELWGGFAREVVQRMRGRLGPVVCLDGVVTQEEEVGGVLRA